MKTFFLFCTFLAYLWLVHSARKKSYLRLFYQDLEEDDIVGLVVTFSNNRFHVPIRKSIKNADIEKVFLIFRNQGMRLGTIGDKTALAISNIIKIKPQFTDEAVALISDFALSHNDASFIIHFMRLNPNISPEYFIKPALKMPSDERIKLHEVLRKNARIDKLMNIV